MPSLIQRRLLPLLVLLVGVGCRPSSPDTAERDQPSAATSTSSDYHLTGEGDTTLVLVHGWNIDQEYWDDQVKAFSDQYTVLTMNLVTNQLIQDSSRQWTADNFARDIMQIIEQEALDNLILVGHSMAGEIVLSVRELMPDKTLAIIGVDCYKDVGFILTENVQHNIDSFLVRFEENYEESVEKMVTADLFEGDTEHQEAYERVQRDYRRADPEVALAIYRNLFPALATTKEKIGQLPFPLRIIVSDYTPFTEEALQQYAKNGYQVKTIRRSGHFPMIEQPEAFNQALGEFLEAIRASASG